MNPQHGASKQSMANYRYKPAVDAPESVEKCSRTLDELNERLGAGAIDIVRVAAFPIGRNQWAALLGRCIVPLGIGECNTFMDGPLFITRRREAIAQRLSRIDRAAVGRSDDQVRGALERGGDSLGLRLPTRRQGYPHRGASTQPSV